MYADDMGQEVLIITKLSTGRAISSTSDRLNWTHEFVNGMLFKVCGILIVLRRAMGVIVLLQMVVLKRVKKVLPTVVQMVFIVPVEIVNVALQHLVILALVETFKQQNV